MPPSLLQRLALETVHGRPVQDVALGREPRTVARAVPAALRAVPVDLAAEVRAQRRHGDERAVVATVPRDLLAARIDDVALSGREVVDRPRAALRDAVAEEPDPRLRVLLDEAPCARARREAVRVEQLRPRVLAPKDRVGQDH